jgi:hypothetical protein
MDKLGKWSIIEENWTRWETQTVASEDLLWFEKVDPDFWYWFQSNFWWSFWLIIGLYWVLVFSCIQFMKNRQPVEGITRLIIVYDVGVSVFSILALWRLAETFIPTLLSTDGFHQSLCVRLDYK